MPCASPPASNSSIDLMNSHPKEQARRLKSLMRASNRSSLIQHSIYHFVDDAGGNSNENQVCASLLPLIAIVAR